MTDLATRLEQGTAEQQRELLSKAVEHLAARNLISYGNSAKALRFIDAEAYESAALMLVPEGWSPIIDCVAETRDPPSCQVECWKIGADHRDTFRTVGTAATPALAICAAALRTGASHER